MPTDADKPGQCAISWGNGRGVFGDGGGVLNRELLVDKSITLRVRVFRIGNFTQV